MTPGSIARIILYSAWACFAIIVGSEHKDIGELCTFMLIAAGLVVGEAWACKPRHPNRICAVATLVIVCVLALRCTAQVLKWETVAFRGEATDETLARHYATLRTR